MRIVSCLCAAALLCGVALVVSAQEKDKKKKAAKKDDGPKVVLAIVNLYNPCGVAVQPDTGDVFISDSGNLRVLRYQMGDDKKITEEIVGFPKDVYGKGPKFAIGPLGLAFLNKNTLAVGGGGNVDGEELLRFFNVATPSTQEAGNPKKSLGPIGPKKGQTAKGEGNFYALAYVEPTAIYLTTNGDDTKGWVAKATIKDNDPQELTLAIATKEDTEDVDAPVGITVSPDKKLVIGQMGEINKPKDSLLLVYNVSGDKPKLELKAETGLFDISGLAYHPKSKNLYAIDYAWMNMKEGGLFKLNVKGTGEKATVEAEKIVSLSGPTAMAFDEEGNLYVTEVVEPTDPDKADKIKKKPGRLVRIVGLE